MGHKGHWGEYTGNAKWSRDHAHTRVTSKNYDDAVKDDAAHIDYLKRDINYDAKHGHNDENMTADEKHISKLAGDIKYDKKHHSPAKNKVEGMTHAELAEFSQNRPMPASGKTGYERHMEMHKSEKSGLQMSALHNSPATHPAGSSGRKQEHEHPHGKGKLVYTDKGQPQMSAFHKHDEWQTKIDAAKEAWKNADPPKEGDFYEENRKLYEAQEKARLAHDKEEKRNAAPQKHCMGDK